MAQTSPTNSLSQRLSRLPRSGWLASRTVRRAAIIVGLAALVWWGYSLSAQPVTLIINNQTYPVRTHQLRVSILLRQQGLRLEPEDIVTPPLDATLAPGDTVTIQLARPVVIEADGQQQRLLTHAQTLSQLLASLKIDLHPRDELLLNGAPVAHDAALPAPQSMAAGSPPGQPRAAAARPVTLRLVVHRAVPVTLHNGPAASTFYTAKPTIGEALLEQGLTLYLGDSVTPGLGTPLSPGMQVYLEPSTPVSIRADGQIIKTRTQRKTVGEVLAQEGIALMGQDYSRPGLDQPLISGAIDIVRVTEKMDITEEFIPFETEWVAEDTMELDQREIRQSGATGIIKSRTRVRLENGQEVSRQLEDEWLAQAASDQIIAYGTKVVVRTLDTPDGPIEYWRKISMRATAYNAASSGKDADHPRYGITRSGLPAGKGVVAVDQKVIPLNTRLYIDQYGPAVAGDTGGRILGKHIDLGYPDGEPLPVIFDWRNVYVLTPVPPASQIRYVLPNWPQE